VRDGGSPSARERQGRGPTETAARRQHARADDVTLGVVNFNGRDRLPETLTALARLERPPAEVIVVDNASTDGSADWVEEHHRQVRCLRLDDNLGSAAARNRLLDEARTPYVLLLDNDIVLAPDALDRLLAVMREAPGAAICHPEIVDREDPALSQHYNGGYIHYLCAHLARSRPVGPRPDYEGSTSAPPAPSWSISRPRRGSEVTTRTTSSTGRTATSPPA